MAQVVRELVVDKQYEFKRESDEEKKNLYLAKALMVKEYLNKYRCSFPDYHCPSPCKSINLKRKL